MQVTLQGTRHFVLIKCFQNSCVLATQPFPPQIFILMQQKQTAFENIVGKEEIACNEKRTSIFSFFNSVLYSLIVKIDILRKVIICICDQFGQG